MEIKLTTSSKSIELANMILARATEELEGNQKLLDFLGINNSDVAKIKTFRKQLLKAYLK